MKKHAICVLGGGGFVGRYLASRLVRDGHHVRILSRRPERHRDLLVLPTLEVEHADVNDVRELASRFRDRDVVVNLVGILNEKGDKGIGFRRAHVELAEKVTNACRTAGVKRLLHMSALHASASTGPSHYLRTKGQAEDHVHKAAGINVTSFRPSVIFGPGDSFFNRFADLLRLTPGVFPLAMGKARFAPVYVGDVVHCFAASLDDPLTYDKRFDLCGPHTYTLQELVEYTASVIGVRRKVIALGKGLSALQANLLEYAPGKPFSRDNYRSLQIDSICSGPFPDIFGITPQAVEAIVPTYLGKGRRRDRLNDYRRHARHEI